MPSKINPRFAYSSSVLRVWNSAVKVLEDEFLPVEWGKEGVGSDWGSSE